MPKCDFNKVLYNFIEIALWHGCSSVNLLHIFRTPFLKNTSGQLPLIFRTATSIKALVNLLHWLMNVFKHGRLQKSFCDIKRLLNHTI